MTAPEIRCGILGPGRNRNGLGPFLARWFEQAGLTVVAAAGREFERTRVATLALAEQLGHAVDPRVGVGGLLEPGDLDVLVVASPHDTHADAIRAGLAAGVHVYCEKPIVTPDRTAEVRDLCAGFRDQGLVLFENCQWPCFLEDAFDRLYPERTSGESHEITMMLSPSGRGVDAVLDSVSHLLSVVQAVVDVPYDATETDVRFADRSPSADTNELTVRMRRAAAGEVVARLLLEQHREQPRPAWIEIDGARVDREIRTEDYAIFARAHGERILVDDPLARLVYRFAQIVREPTDERVQRESHRIHDRARYVRDIVAAW